MGAWLKDTADPVVRALDRRIAAVTGLDLRPPYAEYLQVVNYGLGGHYEPHFDHATSRKSPLYRMKSGNRIATIMIYLSAVEAGGSTAFIYANFSVPVVKLFSGGTCGGTGMVTGTPSTPAAPSWPGTSGVRDATSVTRGDKGLEGGKRGWECTNTLDNREKVPQYQHTIREGRRGMGTDKVLSLSVPVANKWIHEHGQEFRRPCSADPQD
ncbi:hypothetical protein IHE44_0006009 [Lamprotornis superbus]|uniref:Prolyl 4-hydroxylase alpha subunit Fe(2+) 2OG dioxygenase domain-containing protein n=1 Tax=Lamprotornis superbus TaxID=245042 RepID=A0A835NF32_9PASS|nr:hypothetical protein IHE44_0006009 [Lamprotornis superbus]